MERELSRRRFLKGAFGAGVGLGLMSLGKGRFSAAEGEEISPEPKIRAYRTLGRTGLKVSDIGAGTYGLSRAEVLDYAVELGINYIDTAPNYGHAGTAEKAVGEMLKRRKERVIVATKWYPEAYHDRNWILNSLNESLRRLGTDHVDIIMLHRVNERARLTNPEVYEAFQIARREGKARFLGISGHGSDLMTVMEKAVEMGIYDVMMVPYNFDEFPLLRDILRGAKEEGMGVIVMKTLKGAKHAELSRFQKEGVSFPQAALRWALSDPLVDIPLIKMENFDQVREYVGASGQVATGKDALIMRDYLHATHSSRCRQGCGACLAACPQGVMIPDILRFKMYFEDYNLPHEAGREYSLLPPRAKAETCSDCASPSCETACPFGLPIGEMLKEAHRLLKDPSSVRI